MGKTVKVVLSKLHSAQIEIKEKHKRFSVISCGRRWGKSVFAGNQLCETALRSEKASYFAPTYKLLDITFKECISNLAPVILRSSLTDHTIELITGGTIDFWSMQKPDSGRGRKYNLVIIDEAAFVPGLQDYWYNAIRPTLTDMKGDAWFFSTPKGKNDFYYLYSKGLSGEEGWSSSTYSTYTNPFIDPAEIDTAKRDMPELAFQQEYMAQFNDNVANPFGTTFIEQCTYPISNEPAVIFGIDVAKYVDYTVIIGLDRNGSVCHLQRFQTDWRTTIQTIRNLPPAKIIIDSTGNGDPIGEELARYREIEMFHFTSNSKQQIMEGLAVAIQKREISFPEGIITNELHAFRYEYTKNGVRYSAPVGLHDDTVCALALANSGKRTASMSGNYSFL